MTALKGAVLTAHRFSTSIGIDVRDIARRVRYLSSFAENRRTWIRRNQDPAFKFQWSTAYYMSFERAGDAGAARGHYFFQDLWAARRLHAAGVRFHVDVGSRLDGFIAHVLPFSTVAYVDLRPLPVYVDGLRFVRGSLLALPIRDASIASLSCLHVLEHVGLGRYADPVDPEAYRVAMAELARVIAPGGVFLLSTPVGRERLCFDAHRVFDPERIVNGFPGLSLMEFALIDDTGTGVRHGATLEDGRRCEYGCGLFAFSRPGVGGRSSP